MLVGLGEDKTPIEFELTSSTVNVTRVTFERKTRKNGFRWRNIYDRALIFHIFIGPGKYMARIGFGFTRSKSRSPRSLC